MKVMVTLIFTFFCWFFFFLRIVGLLSSALQGGGQVLENVAFQEK